MISSAKENWHERFDAEWYLKRNPDVAQTGTDPLEHFLRHGLQEGRAPNAAEEREDNLPVPVPEASVATAATQSPKAVAQAPIRSNKLNLTFPASLVYERLSSTYFWRRK